MSGLSAPSEVGAAAVLRRNNVMVTGVERGRPLLLAHGFGCDASVWSRIAPTLATEYPVVLFDQVGTGNSDAGAYDPDKHSSLSGYADDVVEICEALDLRDAVLIAHSVAAMIAVLAAPRAAGRIGALVLVAPSPCYLDDPATGYQGGFTREEIDNLLDTLTVNYVGWSAAMAPVIMGNPDRPELGRELEESFCRTDPSIAGSFARVTFLSDSRQSLSGVDVPTLVLQCSDDALAAVGVGEYVHAQIPGSEFVVLEATGHCPHLSAPEETTRAITDFLDRL